VSTTNPQEDIDNLVDALREGRPLRPNSGFKVLIGDENLNFRSEIFTDPCPLGRQFIERVGGHPVEEYATVAILQNGDFEDIRLDELYDLRGRGAEKVLVFRTDRSFKFKIDHRDLEWPHACISGFILKKIADLPKNYSLWQEVRGGHDRKIANTDLIRLDEPGVERFISLIDQTTEGRELLPSADRAFLEARGYTFEVIQEGKQTGVVIKDFPLPAEKYAHTTVDLLILLPGGYPDCAPDMFYTYPKLSLKATGHLPAATSANHVFAGRTWQRWSRHNNAWRPGIDGLQTMIARVTTAIDGAR
jgi:hypothetical protein